MEPEEPQESHEPQEPQESQEQQGSYRFGRFDLSHFTLNELQEVLDYVDRIYHARMEEQSRCMSRCSLIKEELMIRTWHPDRILNYLELGYDIEDI